MRNLTSYELALSRIVGIVLAAYLIPAWCGPCYHRLEREKAQIAQIQIKELENALQLYRIDVGGYPTTKEGLPALIRNPGKAARWLGPYLQKARVPNDPWGRPYIYRCPGKHGEFDLISYGADGLEGGNGENSDVTSWEATKSRR